MQREDHAVSVAEVKDIMDEAIEHSQKANVKHLARRVFGKSTDESDRIILKEEDFRIQCKKKRVLTVKIGQNPLFLCQTKV